MAWALRPFFPNGHETGRETMAKCDRLVDVGRRQFLRGAGIAAAGVAASGIVPQQASAATGH